MSTLTSEALAEVVRFWFFVNVTCLTNICPPGLLIWLWASICCPLFDELGCRLGGLVFAKVRPNLPPKMTSHTPSVTIFRP